MKKITLQKAVEEIEIGDQVFTLDTSDATLKKWQKEIGGLQDKLNKLEGVSDDTALDEVKTVMIGAVDLILGKGSGNKIYDMTGKSTSMLMDVVFELAKHMTEKLKTMKSTAAADYVEPNICAL